MAPGWVPSLAADGARGSIRTPATASRGSRFSPRALVEDIVTYAERAPAEPSGGPSGAPRGFARCEAVLNCRDRSHSKSKNRLWMLRIGKASRRKIHQTNPSRHDTLKTTEEIERCR